ncbi:glutathione S-transferase family protein [Cohaesibacter celericrescens]|uniref:Glutathione S-transferase n=1 Tax=Cohaesibacter celericrescens TaxID=2067669 RepID=A0A2N5XTV8_9HYPH|nr:glutathione S-transferase family protein [Cohaesibacter celericrescens]PLW77951.1 glutathione S-transferase [Cohaesibacter celericrescens]
MKLFYSPASPYVRKVMMMALETGQKVEKLSQSGSPVNRDLAIVEHNPTGKVPTVILDSGETLYDSRVITRWMDEQHDGTPMYPDAPRLWTVLRREALADGLLDAALLARYETVMRPQDKLWPAWLEGQMLKIDASLDQLETEVESFVDIDAGLIAIGCALGYLDFRFSDLGWRDARPALDTWFKTFSMRNSMIETKPS